MKSLMLSILVSASGTLYAAESQLKFICETNVDGIDHIANVHLDIAENQLAFMSVEKWNNTCSGPATTTAGGPVENTFRLDRCEEFEFFTLLQRGNNWTLMQANSGALTYKCRAL